MKLRLFFIPLITASILASCSETAETPDPENPEPKVQETFEQRVKHEVETKLEIPVTEKYELKIYRAQMSNDDIEDAIITVNRRQFAEQEVIKSGKSAKSADIGFVGYYNYLFYYDSGLDKITVPIKIGSSPARSLDVKFESITSPSKQDVIVSYRIKNSGFKKFFTVAGEHDLQLMFEWDWFLNAGDADSKGVYYELVNDMSPISKDIFIYESVIDNDADSKKDIYAFEPVITKKGKLIYHFFFDPNHHKYRGIPND